MIDRNGDAPGREFADEFLNLGVTDTVSIRTALKALQARYTFVGAYGIVDYAFKTIQELVEDLEIKLNLPEIYKDFINKIRTKKRLERHGILTSKIIMEGRVCNDAILQAIGASPSPAVVIKASDSCNSDGVEIVATTEQDSIKAAIHKAIKVSGEFFCEEFISGPLYNLDIILNNGSLFIVAITDRYRLKDSITSVAGLQQNPTHHPQWVEFENLALKICNMFSDYKGPLTADIILGANGLQVLEISPHLHVSKLQGIRDPRILEIWPSILAGKEPGQSCLSGKSTTSAYVRIYGDSDVYRTAFDLSWIIGIEEFPIPREFGRHSLKKLFGLKQTRRMC